MYHLKVKIRNKLDNKVKKQKKLEISEVMNNKIQQILTEATSNDQIYENIHINSNNENEH
jgi:hypothetical protein